MNDIELKSYIRSQIFAAYPNADIISIRIVMPVEHRLFGILLYKTKLKVSVLFRTNNH
jgi:hypothetical protein